ncbi:MAG: UDP-glucose/GDP-mannose dehydrogenase family protein, partial [Candidatus Staskawiczbacteria bacterium]|nr:UDP-glucose/GDP-mannose dehydrogenase family protein [Candidatus Staskawiczbacteria bacterium]
KDCRLFLYDKKSVGSMEELNKADYIYICLPTPYRPKKGCDVRPVEKLIGQLAGKKVIIIKSTVIPGTTKKLQKKFSQHKILFNPEFLTEETADKDMSFPESQIIGYTDKSLDAAKEVLKQLPQAPHEMIVPSHVAEFIKYGKNSWFAVKVAVNNELYDLCKKFGLSESEWESVAEGMAADKMVGKAHLEIVHRGKRGYFGKCLPKDMKSLIDFADKLGVDTAIRKSTDDYNDKLLKKQGYKSFI